MRIRSADGGVQQHLGVVKQDSMRMIACLHEPCGLKRSAMLPFIESAGAARDPPAWPAQALSELALQVQVGQLHMLCSR